MDATRGVTNAVLLAVTLAIFNALSKKASDLAGLNGAVIFCPLLAGKVLDTYGNAGYHILFIFFYDGNWSHSSDLLQASREKDVIYQVII